MKLTQIFMIEEMTAINTLFYFERISILNFLAIDNKKGIYNETKNVL